MSPSALAIALSLAVTPVLAATGLDAVQWDKRVLVIFAEAGSPALAQQRDWLAAEPAGLTERDMLVLAVSGDTVQTVFGDGGPFDAKALRATLGPPAGPFEVVLVGKDGGAKLRRSAPLPVAALFATIDAMPMRASEIAAGR